MRVPGTARGQRPKLTPESMNGAERPAVRIKEAGAFRKEASLEGNPAGLAPTFVYWFSVESPADHILFLNVSDLRALTERLGDDTDDWPGCMVVLEKVKRHHRGKTYIKYATAPAHEWDEVLQTELARSAVCGGTTAKGERCRNSVVQGTRHCHSHAQEVPA